MRKSAEPTIIPGFDKQPPREKAAAHSPKAARRLGQPQPYPRLCCEYFSRETRSRSGRHELVGRQLRFAVEAISDQRAALPRAEVHTGDQG